jgi:DNA-binding PadR family transcriptional regulator
MKPPLPPLADPHRLLPLKPLVLEVLLSLLGGERHGYGIVSDIAERSGGAVRIEPGNLYRSLRGMLDLGLIVESDRRPAPDLDDQRRRYYRITPFGELVATEEAVRLRALLSQAGVRRLLGHRAAFDPGLD